MLANDSNIRDQLALERAAQILGVKDADTLKRICDGAANSDVAVNLTICYERDDNDELLSPLEDSIEILEQNMKNAIQDGLITGLTDVEINQYFFEVIDLSGELSSNKYLRQFNGE